MKSLHPTFTTLLFTLLLVTACSNREETQTVSGLFPGDFDSVIHGKKTELVVLRNARGMEVCLTNYGGRVVSLSVPDKNGKPVDVVLGYDRIAQYADTLHSPSDFGATVGRYANRIKGALLTVEGKTYRLRANDHGNCLHGGGNTGWIHRIYDIRALTDTSVTFALTSPDGDNGFPGTVKATATYTVKGDNTLDIVFRATTDRETVINMTNHSYFNLNGDPSKVGTDQVLYINADRFTPTDQVLIPTGEIRGVQGTPLDFSTPHPIAATLADTTCDQIRYALGYDQNWCLNTFRNGKGDDTQVAASLYSPKTGILLHVFTNEPGLQVYTANYQGTGVRCKHGIRYPRHVSVCFESQKYPDSPTKVTAHAKGWEDSDPYLRPGQQYTSHLVYRFSVRP